MPWAFSLAPSGNSAPFQTTPNHRLREAIFALAHEPRPQSSRKLTGREGWRLRVGDYRVLYDIDDVKQTITIVHVGHRRDVYR